MMKVWTRLKRYQPDSNRPLILAIGNFDGVHTGHQKILKTVLENSKKRNGIPAILTFAEHPQRVLHPSKGPSLLTSPQHRFIFFSELGIEICFLLAFTTDFAKTEPEDFVKKWLVDSLQVKEIHLGHNARFGFNRQGDAQLMKQFAGRFHFDFYEAPAVIAKGEFVSSSLIRKVIESGDLARARELLGRPFGILASVVRGSGRGKSLGFPTANLRPHSEILPPSGVYPVEIRVSPFHLKALMEGEAFDYVRETPGEWCPGILNYGVQPTFEGGKAVAEVHILDYSGDLYGKTLEIVFYPKLRDEKKFENKEALITAMQEDVSRVRQFFSGKALQKSRSPLY